jgi:RNA polymerase sigma factor (TIGR02999 family)
VIVSSSQAVTELLANWECGDEEALRALVPLVYNELRRLAHHYLHKERPNQTLQSTALVHEVYIRLVKQEPVHFANRAHFFAVSAQLMREILVEYARRRCAAKHNGGYKLSLDDTHPLLKGQSVDLVALDDALNAWPSSMRGKAALWKCAFSAASPSRKPRRS